VAALHPGDQQDGRWFVIGWGGGGAEDSVLRMPYSTWPVD
jgi:hypothetical protein